jgi:hypothetical protein
MKESISLIDYNEYIWIHIAKILSQRDWKKKPSKTQVARLMWYTVLKGLKNENNQSRKLKIQTTLKQYHIDDDFDFNKFLNDLHKIPELKTKIDYKKTSSAIDSMGAIILSRYVIINKRSRYKDWIYNHSKNDKNKVIPKEIYFYGLCLFLYYYTTEELYIEKWEIWRNHLLDIKKGNFEKETPEKISENNSHQNLLSHNVKTSLNTQYYSSLRGNYIVIFIEYGSTPENVKFGLSNYQVTENDDKLLFLTLDSNQLIVSSFEVIINYDQQFMLLEKNKDFPYQLWMPNTLKSQDFLTEYIGRKQFDNQKFTGHCFMIKLQSENEFILPLRNQKEFNFDNLRVHGVIESSVDFNKRNKSNFGYNQTYNLKKQESKLFSDIELFKRIQNRCDILLKKDYPKDL